jgi:hypothetical protein
MIRFPDFVSQPIYRQNMCLGEVISIDKGNIDVYSVLLNTFGILIIAKI